MIEKQKVLHVMNEFYKLMMESKKDKKETLDISLNDFVMSGKGKELFLWLESLSPDELIDLVALTDYGREHRQRGDMKANCKEFEEYRDCIATTFANQIPNHIANYLLGKALLAEYLQFALPLYDETEKKNSFSF